MILKAPLPTRRLGAASLGRALARRLPLVGALLGLALAFWLIATNDLGAVADAFGRIGAAGLVAIVAIRVASLTVCGLAWARILDGLDRAETGAYVILRFVREGINVLLPVASIGGEVVGGRLLTFWGVGGGLAAASILADLLIQAGTQGLFALFGVGLLTRVEGETAASLAGWTLRVLALTAVALGAFFAIQRSGAAGSVAGRLARIARRLSREPAPSALDADPAAGMSRALDAVWARGRRSRLAQSAALHLAAWCFGAVEIWVALACIGVEGAGFTAVVVIEALSQAIKSAAFPIPSGLGVQEGGFVLVGGLFGIDAGTAIALSLAKRVPDVALGLPSLFVWQSLEARRATILPPPAG